MRNIMEIARLIRCLEDDNMTDGDKIEQIKIVRDSGHITEDEAFELAVEYFTA